MGIFFTGGGAHTRLINFLPFNIWIAIDDELVNERGPFPFLPEDVRGGRQEIVAALSNLNIIHSFVEGGFQ